MTSKERVSRRIKEKEVEEKRTGDTGLSSAIDTVPKGGNTDCALPSPSGIPSVSVSVHRASAGSGH